MGQEVAEAAVRRSGRSFVGRVVSNSTDKTVTVEVSRVVQHPRYHKYLARTKKLTAHDEGNECVEGDTVVIHECRPMSKTKRWLVVEKKT